MFPVFFFWEKESKTTEFDNTTVYIKNVKIGNGFPPALASLEPTAKLAGMTKRKLNPPNPLC